MGKKIISVINITSSTVYMEIVEIGKEAKIIDRLKKKLFIGKEVFNTGKISHEIVEEACSIFMGFKNIMNSYSITEYYAAATSIILNARNINYVLDQIKQKTGIKIEVLDTKAENTLLFNSLFTKIKDDSYLNNGLILKLGHNTIQIMIYKNGALTLSQNVSLGSLRIHELLYSIENGRLGFLNTLEEYIESYISAMNISKSKIENFTVIGKEVNIISFIINLKKKLSCDLENPEPNECSTAEECLSGEVDNKICPFIEREDFERFYEECLYKTPEKIEDDYNISSEHAEVLIPALLVFKKVLDFTDAETIFAPIITINDGLIAKVLDFNGVLVNKFHNFSVSLARSIGKRYKYNEKHNKYIEEKCLYFFDKLKLLHGLGQKERNYLQIATILHDVGKYISINNYYEYSRNIINATEFLGISSEEIKIISQIAYHHEDTSRIEDDEKLIVSKLVAILALADSLDKSRKQKIKDIKLTLEDKLVVITVKTVNNILLEQWTFEKHAKFFREVFGVNPILKILRKI